MNFKPIIIVGFVAVGVIVLASLSMGFLAVGKPVEIFGFDLAAGDGQFIPPAAGALAFMGGIIFLLIKSKRVR